MEPAEDQPAALEPRPSAGARLHSPSAARNKAVIAELLAERLPDSARVLEIACGSGEHGLAAVDARPDISWTPSDIDADARASAEDWAQEASGRIAPAISLDAAALGWEAGAPAADAVFCANMIHIAPWDACVGLFRGAGRLIAEGGLVILYGPFMEGQATAPSNLDFDRSLKARDPRWGVRALSEVDACAAEHGFDRIERVETPANNRLIIYRRRAA